MMKVAYIAAGAGDLYCGACAGDLATVRALRRIGIESLLVPLYTPLRDSEGVVSSRVFLGGVSTWLRQVAGPLNGLVWPLRPFLDSQLLLRAASGFAIRTDPHTLGPLTVSMLRGPRGPHAREARRVAAYLRDKERPDVVHLSNSLLSGLAGPLKDLLNCPVICSVQGEEHFLAALPGRYQALAIACLRENLRNVDVIIRPTTAGAGEIGKLLARDPSGFAIVPPALEAPAVPTPQRCETPITVGYLSAIRPEKGLDLLISALADVAPRLSQPVEFRIAGQVADAAWWRPQAARLKWLRPGITPRFLGTLTPHQKTQMLAECHIFVMPTRLAECRALAALEAMHAGCAVVGPRHGIFTELLAASPSLLFEPGDLRSLSETLFRLLRSPAEITSAGAKARETATGYTAQAAAARLKIVYERCVAASGGTSSSDVPPGIAPALGIA